MSDMSKPDCGDEHGVSCDHAQSSTEHRAPLLSRRLLLQAAAAGVAVSAAPRTPFASPRESNGVIPHDKRFPHFQSTPVPYTSVRLTDSFWAPRQRLLADVTVPWATLHFDTAGGLATYRADPQAYKSQFRAADLLGVRFIDSMAAVAGLRRDSAIEGLCEVWGQKLIDGQGADGYLEAGYPPGADPATRWRAIWWSHEDYALGVYVDAAISNYEVTGRDAMYRSAVRAVDNMASVFLGSERAYAPGHEEIEQALMRLYGATGDTKYLRLCGWLIEARGHHEGRQSYGKYSQDHIPVRQQRTVEGHIVRAGYLFNGVAEYVGATGDAELRETTLAAWTDMVNNKMYPHGGAGLVSTGNEGFSSTPNFLPPHDCFGESCGVISHIRWAHSLFRLTGDAAYLDVAERMLCNAFYASLSLKGDTFFYENVSSTALYQDRAAQRFAWHPVPCCPPNIVQMFARVGALFYSTDRAGIFVKHYGASEAQIPFGAGIKLIQRTNFPWSGDIEVQVEPRRPTSLALRLRVPDWAKSCQASVNGKGVSVVAQRGWLEIRREWKSGDTVELSLPMQIERLTMPTRFKGYENLIALQRGPIVYCLESQDIGSDSMSLNGQLPPDVQFTAEHRPDLLGGVTVLNGTFQPQDFLLNPAGPPVPAMFVPYGVWNNRTPCGMRMWVPTKKLVSLPDIVPV